MIARRFRATALEMHWISIVLSPRVFSRSLGAMLSHWMGAFDSTCASSPKRWGGCHGDSTAKVALASKFSVATGAKRCALARCPLLCCFRVMRGRQAWPAAWAELFTIAKTAGEAAAVNTCSNKFVLSSARRENLEGAHGVKGAAALRQGGARLRTLSQNCHR